MPVGLVPIQTMPILPNNYSNLCQSVVLVLVLIGRALYNYYQCPTSNYLAMKLSPLAHLDRFALLPSTLLILLLHFPTPFQQQLPCISIHE